MPAFLKFLINLIAILFLLTILPTFFSMIKLAYQDFMTTKTKVGVVKITRELTDANDYRSSIRKFFKNPAIKAILLIIDCPGGAAGTSQALFYDIEAFKTEHPKPIITFVENMCASGAYYIATATDAIITTPAATIGSIGSLMSYLYIKDLVEYLKTKYNIAQAGSYKTTGNMFVEQTPEQKTLIQDLTDNVYQQFIADVAQKRPQLQLEKHLEWADGKIFTGKQAIALGLVDHLGSLAQTEKVIREKAYIDGEIDWIFAEPKNPVDRLLQKWSDNEMSAKIQTSIEHGVQALKTVLAKEKLTIHC